jgi:hypothetical protein
MKDTYLNFVEKTVKLARQRMLSNNKVDHNTGYENWSESCRILRRISCIERSAPQKVVCYIQNVPGGKVNILGGHTIDHSTQNIVFVCVLFRTVTEIQLFHCKVKKVKLSLYRP